MFDSKFSSESFTASRRDTKYLHEIYQYAVILLNLKKNEKEKTEWKETGYERPWMKLMTC